MASEQRSPSTRSFFTQGRLFPQDILVSYTTNEVLDNLLVIAQEEKLVSKRRQVCLTMRHDDFDDGQILHAVARYCKVTEEGPIKSLFNILPLNNVENDENGTWLLRMMRAEGMKSLKSWMKTYQIFEFKDLKSTTIMSLLPKIFQLEPTLAQTTCTNHGEVSP